MGLDMYLTKEIYLTDGAFSKKFGEVTIELENDLCSNAKIRINPKRVSRIVEDVGYWRKANAIHRWFVDNVQDGKDNCAKYYVGETKFDELLRLCKEVMANPEKAEILLPTTDGFFFGSTNYDDSYFDDIQSTIDIITSIKEDGDEWGDYYYQSSW